MAVGGTAAAKPGAHGLPTSCSASRASSSCCGARASPIGRSASPLPSFRRRPQVSPGESVEPASRIGRRRRVVTVVVRIPQFDLPRPRLLDLYVSRQYLRVFVLAIVGLLGVFYISTFIDMADRVFRGSASTASADPVPVFRDAAIRVPDHSDGGAGGHAGGLRLADQEQRADRDARLWRQPVSIGGAAALLFAPAQRRPVRDAGERAGVLESSSRRDSPRHARLPRAAPSACCPEAGSSGRTATSTTTKLFDPTRNLFDRLTVFALDKQVLAAGVADLRERRRPRRVAGSRTPTADSHGRAGKDGRGRSRRRQDASANITRDVVAYTRMPR